MSAAEISAAGLIRELLRQAINYGRVLMALLKAEWSEKARAARIMAALAAGCFLLLLTGFWLVTMALVDAIAFSLGSWGWAFLMVGCGYLFIGGMLLLPLVNGWRSGLLRMDRTLHRVGEDVALVKSKLAA